MDSPKLVLWESPTAERVAVRVAVAGDFLPAGRIELPQTGWAGAAAPIAACLRDVSTTFANLECVFDAEGLATRPIRGIGNHIPAPSASLDYLQAVGVRVVSLANNHSYDFGVSGAERTQRALVRRGMIPLGAGRTLRNSPEVFVWRGPGNLRVGFWAAAKASHDLATRRNPGAEPASISRAKQAIQAMRAHGAHFLIALLHAGCIRASHPDPSDAKLMDRIAMCGFDLVAASHSHRISGFKHVRATTGRPSFCFYGLGTLVTGDTASPLEREGLIVVAGFDSRARLVRVELRPLYVGANGFAEVPPRELAQQILERFQRLSAQILDGSARRRFYNEVSRDLIRVYTRDVRAAFRESGFGGLLRKASRIRARHVLRAAHRFIG